MSDFASSLPVRTENNGDVVAQLADGTVTSQKLAIDAAGLIGSKISDGAGTALTSQANGAQQALDVGINVAGVQVDPRSIRALTASDVVSAVQSGTWNINNISGTISLPTGAATSALQTSGNSSLTSIDGKLPSTLGQKAMAASLAVVIASDQSDFPVKLEDGAGNAITSQVNGAQRALDVGINVAGVQVDPRAIRALTASDVVTANIKDATGTAFSAGNPLPVTVVSSTSGTPVLVFQTSAALAGGASHTFSYTVTALKTLSLQQISASGSGKIKVEIQINAASKVVKFNSTASPNVDHNFYAPATVAAGLVVSVIVTNKDNQAQDVYSTIEGFEF